MSVTHVYWNMRVVRVSKIASAFLLIPNAEQKFYDLQRGVALKLNKSIVIFKTKLDISRILLCHTKDAFYKIVK